MSWLIALAKRRRVVTHARILNDVFSALSLADQRANLVLRKMGLPHGQDIIHARSVRRRPRRGGQRHLGLLVVRLLAERGFGERVVAGLLPGGFAALVDRLARIRQPRHVADAPIVQIPPISNLLGAILLRTLLAALESL